MNGQATPLREPMLRPARLLLGFAAALAAVGAGLTALSAYDADATELLEALAVTAREAFAAADWARFALVTAAVAGVAVLLSAVELLTGRRRVSRADLPFGQSRGLRELLAQSRARVEAAIARNGDNVVQAFEEIVRGAVSAKASDIHFSPSSDGVSVTYRIDGTLHELLRVPVAYGPRLVIRAKVLAGLDTQARGLPQDGRVAIELDGKKLDIRLSTLPTDSGERMALRLVRGSRALPSIDALGFDPAVNATLKDLLARPQGVLFVTGAVGNGKTTTMYAALQYIAELRGRTTSIVTIEDPIELDLPFATQTQVNPRTGMTFAATLRSVLRQDPNVLMVGEIRDHETADIAMQASLTGHLLLCTVHADTAAGPFVRLAELEVESFVLASATLGCLSQRLVRTLCPACRRETRPAPFVHERFARHGLDLPRATYYEPAGCPECEGQGFVGRRPIAELLVLDPELRKAVNERRTSDELYALARSRGMRTLLEDGLARAAAGETSLSEVLRVAG